MKNNNNNIERKEITGLYINKYIIEDVKLKTLSEKLCFAYLTNILKNKKEIYLPETDNIYNLIQKHTSLSISTVKRNFDILLDLGYINLFYYKKDYKYYITKKEYNKLFNKEKIYLEIEYGLYDNKEFKNKTFLFIPNEILLNNKLTLSEKFILSYLNSFTKNEKECYSNIDTIAKTFNLSVMQVKRDLSKLSKLDLIDKRCVKQRGFIRKNAISVKIDNVKEYYTNTTEYVNNIEKAVLEQNSVVNNIEQTDKIEQNNIIENVEQTNNIEHIEQINNVNNTNKVEQTNSINNIENVENIEQTEQANMINTVNNIEQATIEQANIENIEQANTINADKIDLNIVLLPKEVLQDMNKKDLFKLYKILSDYTNKIKQEYNNKEE